jgi:RNase P/RNase MRP subunit POP5
MPVKKYRVRYVVFKTEGFSPEDYQSLVKLLKDACERHQPGFHLKIVRKEKDTIIVRCPHNAIPTLKHLFGNTDSAQPPLKARIIGVSGTLKKAVSKFLLSSRF